ncbi:MAG: hypothetical protein IPM57_04970 [Oligoflexia bacterium]|nr:hypothetical protein [Oligoflexia bacterium]
MIGLLTVLSIAISAVAAPVFDNNVPAEIRQQIVTDMNAVGSISSAQASGLHQHIFGPVLGKAYLNFFDTRIKKIGMSSCGSANAVACVIPFLGSNKMWLTQNYIKFSHPQIARSMVVFHEARHSEVKNGNWGHATCPTPFNDPNGNPIKSIWTGAELAGQPACDITPFGSYGSSLIMLKNISKFCTNCSEKVRMDAGIYADDQLKRVTNQQAYSAIRQDLYIR